MFIYFVFGRCASDLVLLGWGWGRGERGMAVRGEEVGNRAGGVCKLLR